MKLALKLSMSQRELNEKGDKKTEKALGMHVINLVVTHRSACYLGYF